MSNNIRNFCIIAHIDHGKSTLADRLLETTGTIEKRKMQDQILDLMPLERERGITIKMQPVRMSYTFNGASYTLHLIDTPGHADFGYEVSRALKTVEGAILLVDATQGVQAQTIFNYEKAREAGLTIIPVINKIDLPNAQPEAVCKEIYDLLGHEEPILPISAKTGEGVEDVLRAVITKTPAPHGDPTQPFKALIFDSMYDPYLGVIAYVRVMEGSVKAGDKVRLIQKATTTDVKETGIFNPKFEKRASLRVGEIGYIATGLKDITQVRVGETVASDHNAVPLPGYTEPKPVIFASFYTPKEADFAVLDQSLKKLHLNDPSLYFEEERSQVLGRGFKCGFLGMLHLDIVKERLKREFNVEPIIFSPSVHYRVFLNSGEEKMIYTAEELPDESSIKEIHEPWTRLDILTPFSYMSKIIDLVEHARGKYVHQEQLSLQKTRLTFEMPLDELLGNFYDKLKSVTQGYASLNYEIIDWRPENLVKLEIVVAGEPYEPLSKIIPRSKAVGHGTELVKKLKELLPKQLFAVALQARVGGQIIAREDLSARRKDVTGYLYGGDITRKMKLLEKQKRGKEKMKERGRGSVEIPNEILFKLF